MGWLEVIDGWRGEFDEVDKWLRRVPGYENGGAEYAYKFFEWLSAQPGRFQGLDVRSVIDVQADLGGRDRYELLDLLQDWVQGIHGAKATKEKAYATIRSVFGHNRVELPRDRRFVLRGDYDPVPMNMLLDEFKAILREANILYRSVFLTKFQGMMGLKEVVWFSNNSWPEVEQQLRDGSLYLGDPERVVVHLPPRKGGGPYFTSLERDAIEALRLYLRKWRGPVGRGEPIYLNDRGNPLTRENAQKMWNRCCVRAGVIEPKTPDCEACGGPTFKRRKRSGGRHLTWYVCSECGNRRAAEEVEQSLLSSIRYGKGSHEGCRDLTASRWEKSGVKSWIADFRMGHTARIDPNDYRKIMEKDPVWGEDQFALASPWLNVVSENPEHVSVRDFRRLERELEDARKVSRDVDWLLSDPEATRILRGLVEERRGD